jgi:hypothetical protein
MRADKYQRHCANHTRNTSSRQTFHQHDIQSLFGADFSGWYIVYTRSQVGTLCESSTTRNVYGYVEKNTFRPPKTVGLLMLLWYIVQMIATILAAFIQVGVKEWIFSNVPDICQADQVSQLTCPQNQVFYTASAVW